MRRRYAPWMIVHFINAAFLTKLLIERGTIPSWGGALTNRLGAKYTTFASASLMRNKYWSGISTSSNYYMSASHLLESPKPLTVVTLFYRALDLHFGKPDAESEDKEVESDDEPDSPEEDTQTRGRDIIKRRQLISHLFNLENLLRWGFSLTQITNLLKQFSGLKISARVPLIDQMIANLEVKGSMDRFATGITRMRDHQDAVYGGVFNVRGLLNLIADEQKARLCIKCVKCKVSFKKSKGAPVLLDQVCS